MGSELKASRLSADASVSVGERVTLGDSNCEYVVVSVDHATGRLELLRLKPGRIEKEVPISLVHKKVGTGLQLDSNDDN